MRYLSDWRFCILKKKAVRYTDTLSIQEFLSYLPEDVEDVNSTEWWERRFTAAIKIHYSKFAKRYLGEKIQLDFSQLLDLSRALGVKI